ncbi:MAG TPA: hypothetical protein VJN88_02985 [Ktedonobacterales bacterium]|nr:hypothetical protein [Ktedonobacterales bacterium]
MVLLQIEHATLNFEAWKTSFDNFAALRQQSGVRRYRISRPIDNPNFAMIELELDSVHEAQSLLAAVQQVWQRVGGTLINDPHWRICEVAETQELTPHHNV